LACEHFGISEKLANFPKSSILAWK